MSDFIRYDGTSFETRSADDGSLTIEGYFAVFGGTYQMGAGVTETIRKGAFSKTLDGDIRALINHDTALVLGRTTAGTLELREDDHGLWGRISINPNDTDAVNLYERVKRGDVSQCSFGFDIIGRETEQLAGGSIRVTLTEVKLYEVSVVTFPAYDSTSVEARQKDSDAWAKVMRAKLKGEI